MLSSSIWNQVILNSGSSKESDYFQGAVLNDILWRIISVRSSKSHIRKARNVYFDVKDIKRDFFPIRKF